MHPRWDAWLAAKTAASRAKARAAQDAPGTVPMAVLRVASELRAAGVPIPEAVREAWQLYDAVLGEDIKRSEAWELLAKRNDPEHGTTFMAGEPPKFGDGRPAA